MRGTRLPCKLLSIGNGIIPAYAGNTTYWKLHELYVRDHPRVCGEHCGEHSASFGVLGSSPRMRGTLHPLTFDHYYPGIIPAYAGNTMRCLRKSWLPRDHPRVCGEHDAVNWPNFAFAGSSPRMRGTLPSIGFTGELVGIIPAYAGNTSICTSRGVMRGDHPRVCGEHVLTEVDG